MCTFLCHLDVMDSVCVLHGCHLARISWSICAVQGLFEENGKGECYWSKRERNGKARVWKQTKRLELNISPLLLPTCPMHACGGLMFAGRL